jgi:hypothetical protein
MKEERKPMQKRSFKFVVPLAVASAAVLAVSTGLASASGPPSGEIHAYEADTTATGTPNTVVLTGAITGTGTDCQGCDPKRGYNVIDLGHGNTFDLDVSKVGNELNNLPVDQTTCSSDGTVVGRAPIVSGTGVYAGITGTLYVDVSVADILPGPPGACETNAPPSAGVMIVKGFGTVSYPGNH